MRDRREKGWIADAAVAREIGLACNDQAIFATSLWIPNHTWDKERERERERVTFVWYLYPTDGNSTGSPSSMAFPPYCWVNTIVCIIKIPAGCSRSQVDSKIRDKGIFTLDSRTRPTAIYNFHSNPSIYIYLSILDFCKKSHCARWNRIKRKTKKLNSSRFKNAYVLKFSLESIEPEWVVVRGVSLECRDRETLDTAHAQVGWTLV